MTNDIAKIYRTVSAQGVKPIEVLAMACERVAKDLYDAIRDIEAHDIPAKTGHLNHALTVIAYIESMVEKADLGEEAARLKCFHNMSRVHILLGSAHLSASILNQIAGHFMEMRSTWKEVQAQLDSQPEVTTPPAAAYDSCPPPASTEPRSPSAWSA
ncbi:MAG: flagellar protein FliS [Candidatus Dormibacteraceae bacterium]